MQRCATMGYGVHSPVPFARNFVFSDYVKDDVSGWLQPVMKDGVITGVWRLLSLNSL